MPPGCCGAGRPENRVTARSKAPQKEVHRAGLAAELAAEPAEHAVRSDQRQPEPVDGVRVVGGVHGVLGERDHLGQLDRGADDRHVDAQPAQRAGELGVEVRDGARAQQHRPALPPGRADGELVRREVEDDLHPTPPVRHERRGQADGVHVQRHVPPVVGRRLQGHPHLADDLGEQVHGVAGVHLRVEGEGRPERLVGGRPVSLADAPPSWCEWVARARATHPRSAQRGVTSSTS